jgi:hypothetical protein
MSDADILRRLAALEAAMANIKSHEHAQIDIWTPVFFGTGTAGTFTYVAGRQDGRYTRLGNMVIAAFEVAISAIAVAPTTDMRITGLPFAAGGSQDGAVSFGLIANINYTAAAIELTGFIPVGGSYIDLREVFDNAGSTAYPAANFTNVNAQLRGTAIYWTS